MNPELANVVISDEDRLSEHLCKRQLFRDELRADYPQPMSLEKYLDLPAFSDAGKLIDGIEARELVRTMNALLGRYRLETCTESQGCIETMVSKQSE